MSKTELKIPRTLTIFMLTMINVAVIGSVKNWAVTAEYGVSSIFFFILATLIFFIPTSLVAAELATAWPELGGVYAWVKEAFGHRSGFLAIWLLWVENIFWFPTVLSFIAATIAYIFNPALATNNLFTFFIILLILWGVTIVNFKGMRTSGWISSLGMILGTFLPGLFIILLGVLWYIKGNPLQIEFSWNNLIPDMNNITQLVLFAGVILSLAGMEMSAIHARDVKNPRKDYPKAILYSAIIILGLSIPGVLSIASVVPQKDLSLVAGSLQAISTFLAGFNLKALTPILALLITVGTIASVSTWCVGPIKGLLAAAQTGDLPPRFRRINKNAMPVPLLIVQGVVISIIATLFIFLPTINAAFWILTAMVTELYLLMYILMFAAAIRLRYKHPRTDRPYKIPGGKVGMWIVSGIGILTCLFTMVIAVLPPANLVIESKTRYAVLMASGVLFLAICPWIILMFKKPSWTKRLEHETN